MSGPPDNGDLEALLEYLYERRNFDFRAYKRASLSRRVYKRMQVVGIDDYRRYMEVLEANPGEFAELFNTILINVTGLMRDREAWDVVAKVVIPAIIKSKAPGQPIRVWSAGCASGEEAYSLAVLFAEALGEERFREQVKIYATDADTEALADARQGRYRIADLEAALGEARTDRFFERDASYGVFKSDLRRALIFGRHDLVQDPPISRIDLISCRNTLMYFTAEVQVKVLTSFQFALNPGGYLFLGKSEALVTRTQMFEVVDLRQHIVSKRGNGSDAAVLPTAPVSRPVKNMRHGTGDAVDAAFEHSPVGQLVLDGNATVLHANRAARRMFAIGPKELGRHLREMEVSFRPADLRTPVERVMRDRRPVTIYDVTWRGGEEPTTLDISIVPMDGPSGAIISFVDVGRYQHLREELEHSRRELETAYEELQSTVEELETTNEELQSTNEELETTNEELHSTNEELETMNEELNSTNEELQTINNEVRERSTEVSELNQFLQSILGSLQSAVIVLSAQMEIRAWNRQAEELWGLRSDEVLGTHFMNLDIGFPVESLRTQIRNCLAGRSERERAVHQAVNRRGRPVDVAVDIGCLLGDRETRGVILMMDAVPRDGSPDGHTQPAPSEQEGELGVT